MGHDIGATIIDGPVSVSHDPKPHLAERRATMGYSRAEEMARIESDIALRDRLNGSVGDCNCPNLLSELYDRGQYDRTDTDAKLQILDNEKDDSSESDHYSADLYSLLVDTPFGNFLLNTDAAVQNGSDDEDFVPFEPLMRRELEPSVLIELIDCARRIALGDEEMVHAASTNL